MLRRTQSLSKNCATGSYFYSLPHSVTVTNVAFSVCAQRTKRDIETLGVWEQAERHVERQKKEERERTPMHGEDGTGSIILRSAYVCVFV